MQTEQTFNTRKNLPLMIVLLSGAFITILNQTLLATALPPIMIDFQVTESTVQWLQSIFMLVNGIMIPVTAFLIAKFTTRKLFIFAMSIFSIGTLVAAISPHFSFLLIGRILQGAGAGIMMPLLQTIMFLIFPLEKRGRAMGIYGLVIGFAPAIGPSLSGYLVDHFPWRSVFYVVFPITIIIIVAAYRLLKNVTKITNPKIDYPSIILSVFGFGGLLYGFSSVGNFGWSNMNVILSLIIGAITLTMFITRQYRLKEPILQFRVLSNRTFTITMIIGMVAFTMLIAAETILPIYMQLMAGFTALESGIMILPGALVMGFLSPFIGKVFDRIGARWLLIIGLTIMTVTTVFFTRLTSETTLTYITVVFAVRMVGIAMVMMPSTTAGLNALPNKLIPHGTAMTNTMRQVAASIGTALFVTIMSVTALVPKHEGDFDALVHGVNIAFYVATAITFIALILSLYVKDKKVQ